MLTYSLPLCLPACRAATKGLHCYLLRASLRMVSQLCLRCVIYNPQIIRKVTLLLVTTVTGKVSNNNNNNKKKHPKRSYALENSKKKKTRPRKILFPSSPAEILRSIGQHWKDRDLGIGPTRQPTNPLTPPSGRKIMIGPSFKK